jgi:opacity protein-like surface antigen
MMRQEGFMTNVRALVSRLALAGLMCVMAAAPARADVTAFLGANTTPANRQVRGLSGGLGLLIVAFEFEYASTTDDPAARVPSLKTGSGNVLLQPPVAFFGVQPYVTTGVGFYSETLDLRTDRGFAYNTGGGVKIALVGPLRLRVDYRVFKLGSGALYSPAHRVYAGLNLKF